ncbi:heterokaryon incompatibility protein-domain-containing protein [Paraphoma chrysanthemicola]|uniref:Heterokaryon incompatibility protein-domain-containing protein n=1 Tax=Paraphoma chrysanthemicola TaxID=798071 RepID=A0A8K0R8M5_9PLEO|nr:heterokaryon incompatibility protein-domain-containing protein [Paraphoma chrysanthemicola]
MPAQDTISRLDTRSLSSRCSVCLDLNLSEEKWFSSAAPDVWRTSALECESCAVVLQVVEPFLSKTRHLYFFEKDLLIRIFLSHGGIFLFELLKPKRPRLERIQEGEIRCDVDGACPWPSIKPECLGLQNAKFASSRIMQWMKQCEGRHDTCTRGIGLQELPTRVIEIQRPGRIRLVATEKGQQGLYACLSHCWGGIEILRTTKSTYLDFQKTIPWNDVPPTFKHALEVTWETGIRYLWIDSLCIVQDDSADWRHEGSKMASIYSHSYFTLAAVASRNAHDGLYRRSRQNNYFEHDMQRRSDQAAYKLYVRPTDKHDQFDTLEMPLFKRAWFFQERFLSNRVVFFGSEELYWECCELRCCECGGLPGTVTADNRHPSKLKMPKDITGWHILVSQYTKLHLTFQTDKLPALQGLAKAWQQTLQGNYLAGLWRGHILNDLMWKVQVPLPRPRVYLGPSWSWVSTDSPVTWNSHYTGSHRKAVSIISISTTPAGRDPMGDITSGELVLKGQCVRATTKHHELQPESSAFRSSPRRWYPDAPTTAFNNVLLIEMTSDSYLSWCLVLRQKPGQNAAYERIGHAPFYGRGFGQYAEEMVITVV